VLERVRVIDRSEGGARDLSLSLPGTTVAGLFRLPKQLPLTAWVCANCGYAELYTAEPAQIRSLRERVAAEGRATAWEASGMDSEARSRAGRLAVLVLAVLLALGVGLMIVLLLFATAAK